MNRKIIALTLGALIVGTGLTACTSDADNAARNLSTAAEQFEIERRITAVNGFTDAIMLEIEGRCSVETADAALKGALEVTCKIGPNEYVKHSVILGDNGYAAVQQLGTADVSVYHHRVILKPENLLPEFDYEAGEQ